MLKGRLTCAGELNVGGEVMTGIFIECAPKDLRDHAKILYCDVKVQAVKLEETADHKFKPCPFCGGVAEEHQTSDHNDDTVIECQNDTCGARIHLENAILARRSWNRRLL